MHIVILGVGAMATLFAARLTEQAEVTLIGQWPAQLRALQNGLLRLTELDSTDTFVEVNAAAPDDIHQLDPADVALVLTKAHKTTEVAPLLRQVLAPDGLAVTLQNGLGNVETLREAHDTVTYGITMQGATVEAAGATRHGGQGPTHIATRPQIAQQVEALVDLLNTAGLPADADTDLDGLLWGKLAINAGINPVTALLNVPNGAVLDSNYATGLMREAAAEVQAVAQVLGITLPFDSAADRAVEVAQATAANRSSMLQDITRGAQTEIDAICGQVIARGQAADVQTPINMMLYRLINALEDLRTHSHG